MKAGARTSTHLGNGCHAVLPRHDNYFWEQLACDDLRASIITDGHHLPATLVKCIVRVKGVSRVLITCDASSLAGLPPGKYRAWGTELEVLPSGKVVVSGTPFLAGSGHFTDVCVANVIRMAGLSLADAIGSGVRAAAAAARPPGHDDRGRPTRGLDAVRLARGRRVEGARGGVTRADRRECQNGRTSTGGCAMNTEPGRGEYPEEEFEIVEVDLTPHLTEEQKSWPVGIGRRPEEEFAIEEPLPALDVRVTGTPEGRLPGLVSVFSDQETAPRRERVGTRPSGDGERRHPRDAPAAIDRRCPRRLERVAKWAAAFGPEVAVTVV